MKEVETMKECRENCLKFIQCEDPIGSREKSGPLYCSDAIHSDNLVDAFKSGQCEKIVCAKEEYEWFKDRCKKWGIPDISIIIMSKKEQKVDMKRSSKRGKP